MTTDNIIYFPINQADKAAHTSAATLLAKGIFSSLSDVIAQRVKNIPVCGTAFNDSRQHGAVLIDGPRGSGKSSVLVNLKRYLQDKPLQLLNVVHILDPIDPTLLEDNDDLFLNVVVAAVLSNDDVKKAMNSESASRKQVHKQLQLLGHALQSMQSQRDQEKQGLDKIRAFMGNQQLVEEVHRFFDQVLQLLGKKILILPIDDVDTSLNRAFENLEVVRRYLTSPIVLPIISGDAGLYQEVTWRAFLHRLTKESDFDSPGAHRRAVVLADDYQRKVLPLQYRLRMPSVQTYMRSKNVLLGDVGSGRVPLEMFHVWLETLLNDQTNGFENSFLPVPVWTVRSLAQVVAKVSALVPKLEQALNMNIDAKSLRQAILMPDVDPAFIDNFRQSYQGLTLTSPERERRNSREMAYSEFNARMRNRFTQTGEREDIRGLATALTDKVFIESLCEHFSFDPAAGKAYLVLKAKLAWLDSGKRVFDTPLFQPLQQSDESFDHFNTAHDLSDWKGRLKDRTLEAWLAQLPEQTILPYPVPERGMMISVRSMRQAQAFPATPQERLLFEFVMHRNFYSSSKTAAVVCIGRIFEIVILSLLRDVTVADLYRILNEAPFFSVNSLASTKTLQGDEGESDNGQDELSRDDESVDMAIVELVGQINTWRNSHALDALRVSPWLVYNVMNKTFNQAWYFNPAVPATFKVDETFENITWVAKMAFHSIWAAFGSFEKGDLYGLPEVIATVNVGRGRDFQRSDLYRQNITPFVGASSGASEFGAAVGSITYFLDDHPLKRWMDDLPYPEKAEKDDEKSSEDDSTTIEAWLMENFGSSTFRGIRDKLQKLGMPEALIKLAAFEHVFNDGRMRRYFNEAFGVKR
ncbi:antiviral RADAR system adenosine triphosphatase RdrA [Duganella sp. HH105]|uniref:antiviral RADAR system adenosine triphosphatase RdrA n=1 Tax=Duganella sp. HH105 TaxID=1781067 RepID=UPI000877C0C1|nr:antiviral RADAR system adenosine triphosphatase RdrA [Duganella sp. HH105]